MKYFIRYSSFRTKMSDKISPGLSYLITFHSVFGITYWRRKKSWLKRYSLLVWNIVIYVYLAIWTIITLKTIINDIQLDTERNINIEKSRMIKLLFIISIFGYIFKLFFVMFILLQGKSILEHFKRQRENIGLPLNETKFSIIIISCQVVLVTFFLAKSLVKTFCLTDLHEQVGTFESINFILSATLALHIDACLISLVLYQCCYVTQCLRENTENFKSLDNFKATFKKLLKIRNEQKSFNRIINKYIFFDLLYQSISIITHLFTLYYQKSGNIYILLLALFDDLIEIIVLCLSSDCMRKAYNRFLQRFEELEPGQLDRAGLNSIDDCLINRLYSMQDDMCFTALELYEINTKTFIKIVSQIITFSVILIQTTG